MFLTQKNANLNTYVQGTLNHLFASQFLPSNPDSILKLKQFSLIIQTKKTKKIHYFYLWLLTGQQPHSAKFNFSQKNTAFNQGVKTKTKKQRVQTNLPQKRYFFLLNDILWHIIAKQTTAEKKICIFQQLNVHLKILVVPLTPKTFVLQTFNSYFPNIPFELQFRFSYTTAFEKLFFLRALKLFSSQPKWRSLDFFEENYV